MLRPSLLSLLTSSVASALSLYPSSPQHIFSNPPSDASDLARIPTAHESAVQARRILSLNTIGTLSTVFPSTDNVEATENRPSGVEGAPIGLMDYFADCEPERGDPTLLAITIATSFKNADAGSNVTLSMRWVPPHLKHYSPANMPRFSLVGYLEDIPPHPIFRHVKLEECFVRKHRDAKWWLPGNPIHESKWVRLVVQQVYWIGGFGDRAYIGWIPQEDWANVTSEEKEGIRLPGEESQGLLKQMLGSWEL